MRTVTSPAFAEAQRDKLKDVRDRLEAARLFRGQPQHHAFGVLTASQTQSPPQPQSRPQLQPQQSRGSAGAEAAFAAALAATALGFAANGGHSDSEDDVVALLPGTALPIPQAAVLAATGALVSQPADKLSTPAKSKSGKASGAAGNGLSLPVSATASGAGAGAGAGATNDRGFATPQRGGPQRSGLAASSCPIDPRAFAQPGHSAAAAAAAAASSHNSNHGHGYSMHPQHQYPQQQQQQQQQYLHDMRSQSPRIPDRPSQRRMSAPYTDPSKGGPGPYMHLHAHTQPQSVSKSRLPVLPAPTVISPAVSFSNNNSHFHHTSYSGHPATAHGHLAAHGYSAHGHPSPFAATAPAPTPAPTGAFMVTSVVSPQSPSAGRIRSARNNNTNNSNNNNNNNNNSNTGNYNGNMYSPHRTAPLPITASLSSSVLPPPPTLLAGGLTSGVGGLTFASPANASLAAASGLGLGLMSPAAVAHSHSAHGHSAHSHSAIAAGLILSPLQGGYSAGMYVAPAPVRSAPAQRHSRAGGTNRGSANHPVAANDRMNTGSSVAGESTFDREREGKATQQQQHPQQPHQPQQQQQQQPQRQPQSQSPALSALSFASSGSPSPSRRAHSHSMPPATPTGTVAGAVFVPSTGALSPQQQQQRLLRSQSPVVGVLHARSHSPAPALLRSQSPGQPTGQSPAPLRAQSLGFVLSPGRAQASGTSSSSPGINPVSWPTNPDFATDANANANIATAAASAAMIPPLTDPSPIGVVLSGGATADGDVALSSPAGRRTASAARARTLPQSFFAPLLTAASAHPAHTAEQAGGAAAVRSHGDGSPGVSQGATGSSVLTPPLPMSPQQQHQYQLQQQYQQHMQQQLQQQQHMQQQEGYSASGRTVSFAPVVAALAGVATSSTASASASASGSARADVGADASASAVVNSTSVPDSPAVRGDGGVLTFAAVVGDGVLTPLHPVRSSTPPVRVGTPLGVLTPVGALTPGRALGVSVRVQTPELGYLQLATPLAATEAGTHWMSPRAAGAAHDFTSSTQHAAVNVHGGSNASASDGDSSRVSAERAPATAAVARSQAPPSDREQQQSAGDRGQSTGDCEPSAGDRGQAVMGDRVAVYATDTDTGERVLVGLVSPTTVNTTNNNNSSNSSNDNTAGTHVSSPGAANTSADKARNSNENNTYYNDNNADGDSVSVSSVDVSDTDFNIDNAAQEQQQQQQQLSPSTPLDAAQVQSILSPAHNSLIMPTPNQTQAAPNQERATGAQSQATSNNRVTLPRTEGFMTASLELEAESQAAWLRTIMRPEGHQLSSPPSHSRSHSQSLTQSQPQSQAHSLAQSQAAPMTAAALVAAMTAAMTSPSTPISPAPATAATATPATVTLTAAAAAAAAVLVATAPATAPSMVTSVVPVTPVAAFSAHVFERSQTSSSGGGRDRSSADYCSGGPVNDAAHAGQAHALSPAAAYGRFVVSSDELDGGLDANRSLSPMQPLQFLQSSADLEVRLLSPTSPPPAQPRQLLQQQVQSQSDAVAPRAHASIDTGASADTQTFSSSADGGVHSNVSPYASGRVNTDESQVRVTATAPLDSNGDVSACLAHASTGSMPEYDEDDVEIVSGSSQASAGPSNASNNATDVSQGAPQPQSPPQSPYQSRQRTVAASGDSRTPTHSQPSPSVDRPARSNAAETETAQGALASGGDDNDEAAMLAAAGVFVRDLAQFPRGASMSPAFASKLARDSQRIDDDDGAVENADANTTNIAHMRDNQGQQQRNNSGSRVDVCADRSIVKGTVSSGGSDGVSTPLVHTVAIKNLDDPREDTTYSFLSPAALATLANNANAKNCSENMSGYSSNRAVSAPEVNAGLEDLSGVMGSEYRAEEQPHQQQQSQQVDLTRQPLDSPPYSKLPSNGPASPVLNTRGRPTQLQPHQSPHAPPPHAPRDVSLEARRRAQESRRLGEQRRADVLIGHERQQRQQQQQQHQQLLQQQQQQRQERGDHGGHPDGGSNSAFSTPSKHYRSGTRSSDAGQHHAAGAPRETPSRSKGPLDGEMDPWEAHAAHRPGWVPGSVRRTRRDSCAFGSDASNEGDLLLPTGVSHTHIHSQSQIQSLNQSEGQSAAARNRDRSLSRSHYRYNGNDDDYDGNQNVNGTAHGHSGAITFPPSLSANPSDTTLSGDSASAPVDPAVAAEAAVSAIAAAAVAAVQRGLLHSSGANADASAVNSRVLPQSHSDPTDVSAYNNTAAHAVDRTSIRRILSRGNLSTPLHPALPGSHSVPTVMPSSVNTSNTYNGNSAATASASAAVSTPAKPRVSAGSDRARAYLAARDAENTAAIARAAAAAAAEAAAPVVAAVEFGAADGDDGAHRGRTHSNSFTESNVNNNHGTDREARGIAFDEEEDAVEEDNDESVMVVTGPATVTRLAPHSYNNARDHNYDGARRSSPAAASGPTRSVHRKQQRGSGAVSTPSAVPMMPSSSLAFTFTPTGAGDKRAHMSRDIINFNLTRGHASGSAAAPATQRADSDATDDLSTPMKSKRSVIGGAPAPRVSFSPTVASDPQPLVANPQVLATDSLLPTSDSQPRTQLAPPVAAVATGDAGVEFIRKDGGIIGASLSASVSVTGSESKGESEDGAVPPSKAEGLLKPDDELTSPYVYGYDHSTPAFKQHQQHGYSSKDGSKTGPITPGGSVSTPLDSSATPRRRKYIPAAVYQQGSAAVYKAITGTSGTDFYGPDGGPRIVTSKTTTIVAPKQPRKSIMGVNTPYKAGTARVKDGGKSGDFAQLSVAQLSRSPSRAQSHSRSRTQPQLRFPSRGQLAPTVTAPTVTATPAAPVVTMVTSAMHPSLGPGSKSGKPHTYSSRAAAATAAPTNSSATPVNSAPTAMNAHAASKSGAGDHDVTGGDGDWDNGENERELLRLRRLFKHVATRQAAFDEQTQAAAANQNQAALTAARSPINSDIASLSVPVNATSNNSSNTIVTCVTSSSHSLGLSEAESLAALQAIMRSALSGGHTGTNHAGATLGAVTCDAVADVGVNNGTSASGSSGGLSWAYAPTTAAQHVATTNANANAAAAAAAATSGGRALGMVVSFGSP